MNRTERRLERIKSSIRIDDVLSSYGYNVHPNTDSEQQFSCDLHGDGSDGKPSARCYPDSNSFYCFGCSTTRDAVQLIREKEGIGFIEAISLLENKYRLPPMPWEDGDDNWKTNNDPFTKFMTDEEKFLETKSRTEKLLCSVTIERSMTMNAVLGYWEEFDRLTAASVSGVIDDIAMDKMRRQIISDMTS